MSIRVDSAARYLCEQSGWSLSNLPLQKLLYLAQVDYADRNDGQALLGQGFQAWDYGPVIPALYGRLKMFGADEVDHDVFYNALALRLNAGSRRTLDSVMDKFGAVSPGKLIELTHWVYGAWAFKYEPGTRGIPIGQADIATEARNRHIYSADWDAISAEATCQN